MVALLKKLLNAKSITLGLNFQSMRSHSGPSTIPLIVESSASKTDPQILELIGSVAREGPITPIL